MTEALNQAVKRNAERFPEDFTFRLTWAETLALNRSQFVTRSQKHCDPTFPPCAFTEHGAIMVATILNSTQAVQMSILDDRTLVRLRERKLCGSQQQHKCQRYRETAAIDPGARQSPYRGGIRC